MTDEEREAQQAEPETDEPLRTSGGVELTDELIERLAAEAEAGYDVSKLQPRRRD